MVIKLEEWIRIRNTTVSDLRTSTRSSLEIKLSATTFRSVRERNLAVIVESAAVNYRQKKMGYNAAQELYNRVQANIAKRGE